jgi:hypothetical protein
MGISFFLSIFTFRTAFSLSFAMKFQRRHWLDDFAWRVEGVTQKFRLSRCLFPLCISLLCDATSDPTRDKECFLHVLCSVRIIVIGLIYLLYRVGIKLCRPSEYMVATCFLWTYIIRHYFVGLYFHVAAWFSKQSHAHS